MCLTTRSLYRYMSKIWPSEFGTHEPWYFIFMPSYWVGCATNLVGCCGFAGQGVGVSTYQKVVIFLRLSSLCI